MTFAQNRVADFLRMLYVPKWNKSPDEDEGTSKKRYLNWFSLRHFKNLMLWFERRFLDMCTELMKNSLSYLKFPKIVKTLHHLMFTLIQFYKKKKIIHLSQTLMNIYIMIFLPHANWKFENHIHTYILHFPLTQPNIILNLLRSNNPTNYDLLIYIIKFNDFLKLRVQKTTIWWTYLYIYN